MSMTQRMTLKQRWRTVKLAHVIISADTPSASEEEWSCKITSCEAWENGTAVLYGNNVYISRGLQQREGQAN